MFGAETNNIDSYMACKNFPFQRTYLNHGDYIMEEYHFIGDYHMN